MPADIILEDAIVKVVDGDLDAQGIVSEDITTDALRIHNEKGKSFVILDGAKGEIRILNQKGGGTVMVIKGDRDSAMNIAGNITVLGKITNLGINAMENKIKKLEEKVAALEAKLK